MKKQFVSKAPIFILLFITSCLADSSTPGTLAEEHRRRVVDSFRLFLEDSTVEVSEKVKEFDLHCLGESYPKCDWQDIPILLELAQSDNVLTGNIPSLMISSYAQRECREGMIALWLIEGLRRRQVEQTVEITVGKQDKTRPYPHYLPLNPMCTQQGMKLAQCENSVEIHQQVLEAYRSWWQQVKNLPPEKAAQVYPLQDTNIRWYGGGVPYSLSNAEKKNRAQLNQKPDALPLQIPKPGPENQGLRLRLAIETTHRDGQDHHTVRIGIVNVSSAPITLAATPAYESHAKDYATYLKAEMSFITFPEILPPSAQTAGNMVTSPPPAITIKPQREFKFQWQSKGRLLKNKDYYNTTPYFPGPGLYSVRARIKVLTKEGKEIPLYSNEQTVSIGGSAAMPKYATAKIVRIDSENKVVTIDLGSHHKIQKGDEFYCAGPFPNYWKLKVMKVRPWNCEASVTVHGNTKRIDPMPPQHAVAQLWCFPPGR